MAGWKAVSGKASVADGGYKHVGKVADGEHTRNVINHHSHRRVADVRRDQRPETLLAGCIPEL